MYSVWLGIDCSEWTSFTSPSQDGSIPGFHSNLRKQTRNETYR
ncbi:hypothetical protein X777_00016 [Ooceraea biroi]|uniref:Uncharacterized protein n=1 Tax=Ooceraea biroi TaxID=2015173 RepID=A0A026VSW6_OOCBI|nr:hypothetical protein X777_00016 [Ooceraea biroi]